MTETYKQDDLEFGAAIFREMQVLRFLGDTAAVGKHEEVLQNITGCGNPTRAQIETFYRQGIEKFIAENVDYEFTRPRTGSETEVELIPTAVYADWKARGAVALIIEIVTKFFLEPNENNYKAMLGIKYKYSQVSDSESSLANAAGLVLDDVIFALSFTLARRFSDDMLNDSVIADLRTRYENDPRYAVFSRIL